MPGQRPARPVERIGHGQSRRRRSRCRRRRSDGRSTTRPRPSAIHPTRSGCRPRPRAPTVEVPLECVAEWPLGDAGPVGAPGQRCRCPSWRAEVHWPFPAPPSHCDGAAGPSSRPGRGTRRRRRGRRWRRAALRPTRRCRRGVGIDDLELVAGTGLVGVRLAGSGGTRTASSVPSSAARFVSTAPLEPSGSTPEISITRRPVADCENPSGPLMLDQGSSLMVPLLPKPGETSRSLWCSDRIPWLVTSEPVSASLSDPLTMRLQQPHRTISAWFVVMSLRSSTFRVPSTTSHLPPVRVVPEICATVASMARVAPSSTRTAPSFEKSLPSLRVAVGSPRSRLADQATGPVRDLRRCCARDQSVGRCRQISSAVVVEVGVAVSGRAHAGWSLSTR